MLPMAKTIEAGVLSSNDNAICRVLNVIGRLKLLDLS